MPSGVPSIILLTTSESDNFLFPVADGSRVSATFLARQRRPSKRAATLPRSQAKPDEVGRVFAAAHWVEYKLCLFTKYVQWENNFFTHVQQQRGGVVGKKSDPLGGF